MSKYKEIKTIFRDGECLLKALADLGLTAQSAANLRDNGVTLKTDYASWGDVDHQVAIAVSRKDLIWQGKVKSYGGMGFAWNGQDYDLVQDRHVSPAMTALNEKLRQRYAFHAVQKQARANGMMVRETTSAGGEISLVLVGYNRR